MMGGSFMCGMRALVAGLLCGVVGGACHGSLDPDAAASLAWTWQACGTLSSRSGDPFVVVSEHGFFSLSMSPEGTLLASNSSGGVLLWRVASRFEDSVATTALAFGGPEHPDVQLSPDGRWLAWLGDGSRLMRTTDYSTVSLPTAPSSLSVCLWPQLRFSPDGRWLAGTNWGPSIAVWSTDDLVAGSALVPRFELPAAGCDGGGGGGSVRVAFSADGAYLATSTLAFYRTSDWQQIAPFPTGTSPAGFGPRDDVKWSPDGRELVVSKNCRQRADAAFSAAMECEASAYAGDGRLVRRLPELSAPFPSYSPEGHWMVAGGTLLHRPSGSTRVFDPVADVALFAPNGDIIAGDPDLTMTRYCRSTP